jgi:CheY-like chemotaxis protein
MVDQKKFILLVLILLPLIAGTVLLILQETLFLVLGVILYVCAVILLAVYWTKYRVVSVDIKPTDKVRVVAIDDEADILRLIRIKLSKENFQVSTASDGVEGVKTVLAERPDVMIVDVMMPGKDGHQVVSEVKKKLGEDAPIAIMLTSKAEESDMVEGLTAGADDYITKPFSPRELIERINVALIKEKKGSA